MPRQKSANPLEQDVQELLDGRVIVYRRRGGNKNWHFRLYVQEANRYIRKSTKTPNLNEARTIAEDAYYDTRAKQRNNLPVFDKTFKEIYDVAILDEARKLERGEISQKRYDLITSRAELYYLPFFKNKQITSITTGTISQYWDFRMDFWSQPNAKALQKKHNAMRITKNPKGSTLHLENRVLHMVFQKAEQLNYLNPQQRPNLDPPAKNVKERRPSLTMEQWHKMRNFMRDEYRYVVQHGMNDKKRRARTLLYYYCYCMVSTGMRVSDMRNIKWENISLHTDATGATSTLLQVHGKGNQRDVIANSQLYGILQEWRDDKLNTFTEDQDCIFPKFDGTPLGDLGEVFETMKGYAEKTEEFKGISTDYMGDKIVLYSLRHTYATFQIMYVGTSYDDLSRNMGNSPKVLKQHYDHVKSIDIAARLNQMPAGFLDTKKSVVPDKTNIIETAVFGDVKDKKNAAMLKLLGGEIDKEEYREAVSE
jgi:integrase